MDNYKDVDKYISQFNGEIKDILQKTREIIRNEMPNATEKISYGMPTFWQGENLIHFAAMKRHLGVYPTTCVVKAFADRLKDYKTSKGAIQFPYATPIPYDLIAEIARFRVKEANGKKN